MDSKVDFTQNILETLNISKLPITSYNNETVNRLYLSQVKTLQWVLEQSNENNNNLAKLKEDNFI